MLKFIEGKNHPNLRGRHCLDIQDSQSSTLQLPLWHI